MTLALPQILTILAVLFSAASATAADKQSFLDLARTGWNYELRTTMLGRDLGIPIHINGRDLSGAALCVVGEAPTPRTAEVLDAFRALSRHVFGKPLPMRHAGAEARLCGSGRMAILRLYSGFPPNAALTADLRRLDEVYDLGLPRGREFMATSPAMAQTFFGRRGAATHLMVQQAAGGPGSALEETYYRSILLEELFQSFTFGMDVLMLRMEPHFLSKLQEVPLNLHRFSWGSPDFMRAMLRSNPPGLCEFDLLMMHAVALAPVDETTEPAFIDFIDAEFERLSRLARDTAADPRFALIVDRECRALVP
ncbi:hypothetical protein [Meridianimarinicoccus roseus]|uniref:hypothetical protein n=1 Tax=Meridianimarinicoccus roseus TaxID=2072018 RepID=UPI001EE67BE0|nr:hypothetical protein [Meridianimarinicoccus roseus]